MPTSYPVPIDGTFGDLLRVARPHPCRPTPIHFIVSHPGYETLVTQVFAEGGEMVDTGVGFTVSDNLLGRCGRDGDGHRLHYGFQLQPGVSTTPEAPVP
jgi:catechol 1,2-dioxygenase